VFVLTGIILNLIMSHTAASITLLLLTFVSAFNLVTSWIEHGLNEQFYSLSAVDAAGHNVPMSQYEDKVMWLCCAVSQICILAHTIIATIAYCCY